MFLPRRVSPLVREIRLSQVDNRFEKGGGVLVAQKFYSVSNWSGEPWVGNTGIRPPSRFWDESVGQSGASLTAVALLNAVE